MDKPLYRLCFTGCIEQANQTEPRKIKIILINVMSHYIHRDVVTITFDDVISCQMARDILGDNDWQFVSATQICGRFVNGLGYKIQNHFFGSLSQLDDH